jgi:hypothetical protein
LLSQRVDAIGHTREPCRKNTKEGRDPRKQKNSRERNLDDVRNAFDRVRANISM